MEKTSRLTGTQKLIAAGAIVALALLSIQAYAVATGGVGRTLTVTTTGGTKDPPGNSTISVTGNGQVQLQPDMAILTVGVTTQDASATTAAQQNANIMSNVISALEKLGINSSEIETTSYDISPQTSFGTGPPTITGYQVTNEVQVTVIAPGQNLTQLGSLAGQVIDAAAGQGANQVEGIAFTASQTAIQQATTQALTLAIQDASGQAKTIASALGVSITGVVSVSTGQGFSPTPVVQDVVSGSTQTPVVVPQSLTISTSVQAVYAIS